MNIHVNYLTKCFVIVGLLVQPMYARDYHDGMIYGGGIGAAVGIAVTSAIWGVTALKSHYNQNSQQRKALEILQQCKQKYVQELAPRDTEISKERMMSYVAQQCAHVSVYKHKAYSAHLEVVVKQCQEEQRHFAQLTAGWKAFQHCIERLLYIQRAHNVLCQDEIKTEMYQEQKDQQDQKEAEIRLEKERAEVRLLKNQADEAGARAAWRIQRNNTLNTFDQTVRVLTHEVRKHQHIHQ